MTRRDSRDRDITSLCFAAAAILLGIALYLNGGFYDGRALLLITIACILCVASIVLRSVPRVDGVAQSVLPLVLLAGLAYQIYRLYFDGPSRSLVVLMLVPIAAVLILKPQALKIWWVSLALSTAL